MTLVQSLATCLLKGMLLIPLGTLSSIPRRPVSILRAHLPQHVALGGSLCVPLEDLKDTSNVQAERWGAELLTEDVEYVDLQQRPFTIRTTDTEVGSCVVSVHSHAPMSMT